MGEGWRFVGARGWLWLATAVAAAGMLWAVGWRYGSATPYTPLLGGLSATAEARDTALLDREGIRWQLQGGGQTLAVENARLADARALLTPGAARAVAAPVASDPASAGIERSLDAMLRGVLGPGKAYVAVNATVAGNRSSSTSLAYAKQGTPLAAQSASAAGGGYSARGSSVAWGRTTTVTSTAYAAGGVQRLRVALLLDTSVPKGVAAKLRASVAAAAGLLPSRGDTLTVARVRFPPPTAAPKPAPVLAQLVKPALAYGPLALLALGLAGFAAAALHRRESAVLETG